MANVRYDFDIIFLPELCMWVGNSAVQNKKYNTRKNTQKAEKIRGKKLQKAKKNIQHFFFPSIFLRIILRIYFYYIRHIKYDIIVFVDTPLILHRSAFFCARRVHRLLYGFYTVFIQFFLIQFSIRFGVVDGGEVFLLLRSYSKFFGVSRSSWNFLRCWTMA